MEDEVESLAREYSSSVTTSQYEDEPKNRGEIDQFPLMVEVFDQNPERRFVIVTNSDTGIDSSDDTAHSSQKRSPTRSDYDDKQCWQFVLVNPGEKEDKPAKGPGLAKRKSHQDLPRLETHFEPPQELPIGRSNSRRNREKPVVDQPSRDSARASEDAYLSPVVTHTAGGRERAYLDFNAGSRSGPLMDAPRSSRNDERRSSTSPSLSRRMSSTTGPRPYLNPMEGSTYNNADEALAFAFMMPSGELPPRGGRLSESPTKTRKSNSPPYPETSRDKVSGRPAGSKSRRDSSTRERGEYYGSDTVKGSRSMRSEQRPRPRRTGTEPDSLLSPDQGRRAGPKGPSPLPSPRIAQGNHFPGPSSLPSPRSSTLPYPSGGRREGSASPTRTSASPPRRREESNRGSRPRASSRSTSTSTPVVPLPVPISFGKSGSAERRTPATVREDSQDSASPSSYWKPGPFDPEKQQVYLDQPITSFRRYSEDVQQGLLPQLPECRWKDPTVPGDVQFLSLPRAENFLICPDCYSGVFAKHDEFGRCFAPAPDRPPDEPVRCNFGSCPWYRIAFLMTLKYRYRDLRLLESVAAVAARQPPCPGTESASRVWFSMMDPSSRRPIGRFHVCPSCARMVSSLLPSIADTLLPLESYSTLSRSACDLYFAPDRKRFLDLFDLMENTHDRAINRRTAPDFQGLADSIRDLTLMEECPRNALVPNSKWHVMDGIPEFSVCEECYDAVVWPMIEEDDNKKKSDVANNFIRKRQVLSLASCQLYSNRMREIFRRACRRNDLSYLELKVKEKFLAQAEIKDKLAALLQQDQEDPDVQKEKMGLIKRLKEIE